MSKIDKFIPRPLPVQYGWVPRHAAAEGPKVILEAVKLHGLREIAGNASAPELIEMAKALGGPISSFYSSDEIPWCGLFVSYILKKAGHTPPKDYSQVRARDFADWGQRADVPSFGDVLVFWRGSLQGRDGHVGFYVCEDRDAFHVLGGNQGNSVNISRIEKARLLACRRPLWKVAKPKGVRPFRASDASGKLSENES